MSEHPPDRLWSGIDIVKLVAGTLGAVSAAVIGSFLGVAGTLTGAAVASLIGGLGTELYQRSLHRGVSKLREIQVQPPVTAPAAVGTPPVATAVEEEKPGHFDPVPQPGAKRRPRWRLIAIPAVAFFVLAMGAITLVEGVAGESFAAMFGKASAGSTTLGSAVRTTTGNARRDQQDAPATETSTAPGRRGADPTATTSPAPDATTTAPAADSPTTTPTQTGAPDQTGGTQPGDTGTQPGDTGGQGDLGSTGEQGGTDSQPRSEQGGAGGEQGLTDQRAPESP